MGRGYHEGFAARDSPAAGFETKTGGSPKTKISNHLSAP